MISVAITLRCLIFRLDYTIFHIIQHQPDQYPSTQIYANITVILFRQYLTLYSLFSQNIDSTRKIPIVRLSLLDKVGGSFKVGYNRIYVILVQKSSYLFVQYAPFSEGLGFAL